MKFEMPTRAALEAVTPAEMLPLGMLRRALYQWHLAGQRADEMARWAEFHPEDEQVARCAAHLLTRCEVAASEGIAARAVRAFFGNRPGPVFIRDRSNDAALLRVDFETEGVSIVLPGTSGYSEAVVFDLFEAEQAISQRIIAALVPDIGHQTRCLAELAKIDSKDAGREWHLGVGSHHPGSLANLAMMMALNR